MKVRVFFLLSIVFLSFSHTFSLYLLLFTLHFPSGVLSLSLVLFSPLTPFLFNPLFIKTYRLVFHYRQTRDEGRVRDRSVTAWINLWFDPSESQQNVVGCGGSVPFIMERLIAINLARAVPVSCSIWSEGIWAAGLVCVVSTEHVCIYNTKSGYRQRPHHQSVALTGLAFFWSSSWFQTHQAWYKLY